MTRHLHIWKILFFDLFVIEFGPVGIFFITFYLSTFPVAALALGLATLVALIVSQVVNKRVPWFAIFSGSITMATSLATYLLDAPGIMIIKDTVYYALFALLVGMSIACGKHLFRAFFGHIFAIDETGWRTLERRWLVFFVSAGVSNELVRIFLTANEWVLYKQAVVVVFVLFGLYQLRVTMRYRTAEADRWGLRTTTPGIG